MTGPLHLAFHATQVLLFRSLMHPATKMAKATPGSNLRQTITIALKELEYFTTFMSRITKEELDGFWGRREFNLYPLAALRCGTRRMLMSLYSQTLDHN